MVRSLTCAFLEHNVCSSFKVDGLLDFVNSLTNVTEN